MAKDNEKSNDESKIKVQTPLGIFSAEPEEDNLKLNFSAYNIIDFKAALSQPTFEKANTIKSKAIKAGRINQPSKDAVSLSLDEMSIVATAKNALIQTQAQITEIIFKYRNNVSLLETRLTTPLDPTHIPTSSISEQTKSRDRFETLLQNR